MDEKPDQIVNKIEEKRDELGRNLEELENKVKRNTDWHTYYDRNPMLVLGAALGGGLLLGAVAGGSLNDSGKKDWRSSSAPSPSYLKAQSYEPVSATAPSDSSSAQSLKNAASAFLGNHSNEITSAIDQFKGALIAFGIGKVKEFLSDAVPGLGDHLGDLGHRTSKPASSSQGGPGMSGTADHRSGERSQPSGTPAPAPQTA